MLHEQDRIKKLLNEFLNPGFYTCMTPEFRAKVICDWHRKTHKSPGTKMRIQTLPPEIYPLPISSVLKKLYRVLDCYQIKEAYIHGSYATGNYVGGSDLDLTCVLFDDWISNQSLLDLRTRLKQVYELLKTVDPLQHHGPYFLTEKMIRNYLECYLPLDVWRHSRPLFGRERLVFNVVKSKHHDKAEFERSVKYYNGIIPTDTEYDRKRFVCMANMIPCVVYPWKTGEYTTKYEATKWMKKKYSWSYLWMKELSLRREKNYYDDIEDLKEVTKIICNKIKEIR